MIRAVLVLLLPLLIINNASASGYYRSYCAPTYCPPKVVKVIKEEVVVVPKFVQVPLYSAFYAEEEYRSLYLAPNYKRALTYEKDTNEERFLRLFETMEKRTALLEAKLLESNGGGMQDQPLKSVGAFKRCIGCHDDSNADTKGDGLALFERGSPTNWDCDTQLVMLKQVVRGTMPKGGPAFNEQEMSEFLDYMDRLKSVQAQKQTAKR